MASFMFEEDCLPPYSPASSMSVGSDPSPLPSPWGGNRSQTSSPAPSPSASPNSYQRSPDQQNFPRYRNIYEERLQPLQPSQTPEMNRPLPRPTHTSQVDPKVQARLHSALNKSDYQELQNILRNSSDSLDINEYNTEGQTPLQVACLSGQLSLVQLVMSHGGDPSMTSRDGWNTLHMAAYSGQSDIFQYILLCSKR